MKYYCPECKQHFADELELIRHKFYDETGKRIFHLSSSLKTRSMKINIKRDDDADRK